MQTRDPKHCSHGFRKLGLDHSGLCFLQHEFGENGAMVRRDWLVHHVCLDQSERVGRTVKDVVNS